MSPASGQVGGEPCSLSVGGESFEVVALEGTEAVSELYRYELSCVCPEQLPDLAALLNAEARIELQDGHGASRPIVGIVTEATALAADEEHRLLNLVVRPPAYRLTLGRDSRVFQDATVVDIVSDVLSRGGIDAQWEVGSSYDERVYTAQYRESDWQFVSRLLEEEGIYYWFDHDQAGSALVLTDHSTDAPELHGGAPIPFERDAGAQQASGERVELFGDAIRVVPSKFTIHSFDPERPALKVQGSTGEGLREWYAARGAGLADPAAAQRRAELQLEAAQAHSDVRRGAGPSVRLVPGRIFDLQGHSLTRLDGRHFVTRSALQIEQRRRGRARAADRPLRCTFECLPAATAFRPPRDTPRAKQAGLQTAQVVGPSGQEVHPDSSGRVRVQQRWDRQGQWDDEVGRWVRVIQRGTAESVLLPRMGWNVLTVSEEGSVDLPVVVARIFDGEHPPTYALPEAMTRVTYRTATTPGGGSFNELRYEDISGSQEMFMNASKNMQVTVNDAKTEAVHNDVTQSIGVNSSSDVGNSASENVVGNQSVTVGGNDEQSTGAALMQLIGADQYLSVGGLRKLWVGLTESTHVVNVRQLLVGGALIDVSLGDVSLTSPLTNVLVGGAMVKCSVNEMNEVVNGWGAYQTIGGAKFELAAINRAGSVTGAYTETVGATMTAKTKTYSDQSDSTLDCTVVGSLEATGKEILVEGTSKLELVSGGSSITITDGEVIVKAPALDQTGGIIVAEAGGKVKFN